MDPEVESQSQKNSEESPRWKFYVVISILGLYAVVMTTYFLVTKNTVATDPQPSSNVVSTSSSSSKDSSSSSSFLDVKEDSKKPSKNPEFDNIVKEVLPKEDLKLVKSGWKLAKKLTNPTRVAMSAVWSTITSVITLAVVCFLGYLAYVSTQKNPPLLPVETVHSLQNYTRLAMAIGSGGLFIASMVIVLDTKKVFSGFANLSVIFFALVCVACCFFFTFAELAMNAQALVLPDINAGVFSGKTASSLMTWMTSFLQVNMTILGSGLMIMWFGQVAAQWALSAAEGTTFHKACSVLALPLTSVYMSARRTSNIIYTVFRFALMIISFAMTINLLTPD